jgi:hypothetical protein
MLDKEKLNTERQSLYADIDKTIGDLVKARLNHAAQAEVDALHQMETLMVQTQQLLDCMGEMFEPTPIDDDLEKAADDYADKHGFRVPYDGSNNFYDDVDVRASKEGFIAGAQWKEEQILKNADEYIIDGIVVTDVIPNALSLKVEGLLPKDTPLKFGDKVKLMVRKED